MRHWIFAFDGYVGERGGWMANGLGVLDFAGGTAVEINSGASALALALVPGRRRGWPREPMGPHNLPNVMLGAGLLWFGWFGFNAGSALAAGAVASNAYLTTMTSSAAAVISCLALEHRLDGRPTSLGGRPRPSRAWWPSPRPASSSTPSARWRSACSPGSCASSRSG